MHRALIGALVASLAIHALVLFGPDVERAVPPEPAPLLAELRPAPLTQSVADEAPAPAPLPSKPLEPHPSLKPHKRQAVAAKAAPQPASASPVLSVPDARTPALAQNAPQAQPQQPAANDSPTTAAPADAGAAEAASGQASVPPAPPRLPPRGTIRYRVDRGDSNFEIGYAQHDWEIADGRYRLHSVAETTGLVWLFKSVRIEMESRGSITAAGLQPQVFSVRRNGQLRERADFDWETMRVRVAGREEVPLDAGAQDLLSFNYQLGYLAHPASGDVLPIATGKKYEVYHLEVLGDETIEVPAGALRTLHLRTPGASSRDATELWLAYDYLLLPVKIRYLDAQGASYVQLATRILVGDGDGRPADTDGSAKVP